MTESLIGSRDRESSLYYSDLVVSEEFLGSHALRIPVTNGTAGTKDDLNVRDSRGKAKQVTTVNGRTVIIKENSVYSNKGGKGRPFLNSFRVLNRISRVQVLDPSPAAV